MARRNRFHSPSSTYHAMLRGNDGQPIFYSNVDRSQLCLFLQQGLERFDHQIEAFCFMTNHIHLAIRVAEISLSEIIHHLAFRYTNYINRLYKRVGHLFQGRFKSVLIEDSNYLKELIRYIHLNPVRANLVSLPQDYLWSSHRTYLGLDRHAWISKERILKRFHEEGLNSLHCYEKYVLQGIGIKKELDFETGYVNGILGSQEFVEEIEASVIVKKKRKVELSELVLKICEIYHLTQLELTSPGKNPKYSQARAMLALLVRESEHLSLESLGKTLGRDASGLTKLASRFEIKCTEDKQQAMHLRNLRCWLSESIEM